MTGLIIIISLLITTFPFIYYNKDKISDNKIYMYIWDILSIIISYIVLKIDNINNIIPLFIGSIIGIIINYFIKIKYINIKEFLKAILIFIIFYLSSLIQLIPIIIFKLDYDKLSGNNKMNLSLFSDICLLILLLIYYRKDIIKDIKDLFKNINNYMDTGFKYWLLGLLGMILSNFIILSIIPSAKTVNEETVQGMIRSSLPIISLLMIGIIGPIIEELVFRKSFKKAFNNKYLFIIGTGLFFGATHIIFSLNSLFDLFYIIPYSFLGIAFGIIYYKTNNISVSIMMHIIHNTLLTIISIGGLGLIIW